MDFRVHAVSKFKPLEITERVEPTKQLEYRYPVLHRDQYTVAKCEKHHSNQGPAAENAEKAGESV